MLRLLAIFRGADGKRVVRLGRPLSIWPLLFAGAGAFGAANEEPLDLPQVRQDEARIEIDGRLTEALWSDIPGIGEFLVVYPDSLAVPRYETLFKAFYTERGLYLAWEMAQPPETLVKRFSSRDYGRMNRDMVGFQIDASGEGHYGYWMELALGDAQTDGTLLPERRYSQDWDGAWWGATAETEDGWTAEAFLPWSQMAMPKTSGSRRIGLYSSRRFAAGDERWAWPPLTRTQPKFLSAMQPVRLSGVGPRQQWSLFPYASATGDEIEGHAGVKAGLDLFWRPSTNLQLTATLNPDFGNVESDQVIVNLTAFETFFPEKRLFFQEGQEIFSTTPRAGSGQGLSGPPVRPVNTRRIGGLPRAPETPEGVEVPARELGQPTELLGAFKATGQLGAFRYGLLAARENDPAFKAGDLKLHQHGRDFTAARLLYERKAADGAQRGLGWISTVVTHPQRDAFVHGLDFHYLSAQGHWQVDGQILHSNIADEDPSVLQGKGYGAFVDLIYTQRQGLNYGLALQAYDDVLDINDMGFMERNDAAGAELRMNWTGTGIPWVRNFRFSPFLRAEINGEGLLTRAELAGVQRLVLRNLHELTLFSYWNPERYEDRNSFGNGAYRIEQRGGLGFEYETDSAKPLSAEAGIEYSGENLGGRALRGSLEITWRPIHQASLKWKMSYKDRHGWLLHQEERNFTSFKAEQLSADLAFDFFPSAKHQFRLALQWVGIRAREDEFWLVPARPGDLLPAAKPPGPADDFTRSALNFQARYHWQIAPLSDLWLVYTRNASPDSAAGAFSGLFQDAWNDPSEVDLVAKLRYRLGS